MTKYVNLETQRPLAPRAVPPAAYAAFVAHASTFSPWMRMVLRFKMWRAR